MGIKLCQQCGYEVSHKARTCTWCGSPMKNRRRTVLLIAAALLCLAAGRFFWNADEPVAVIPATHNKPASVVNLEQPPVDGTEFASRLYVQAKVVNLRKHPTTKSESLWKLIRGQKLTELHRAGSWVQVFPHDTGGITGWVHQSLVGKKDPHMNKFRTTRAAFREFRKEFNRFNNEIKQLKGVALFMGVHLEGQDEVQVMATNVLLSAPGHYQKKYLNTIIEMWADAKHHTGPVRVALVDGQGKKILESQNH